MPAAASAIACATLGSAPPGTSLLASLTAPSIVRPGTYFGNDSRSARGDTDGIFGAPGNRRDDPLTVSFPPAAPRLPSAGNRRSDLRHLVPSVHFEVIG